MTHRGTDGVDAGGDDVGDEDDLDRPASEGTADALGPLLRDLARPVTVRLPIDRRGHRIGDRFTLLERLGRGGMGEVWRAHDERLQRDVALKVVRGSAAGLSEARAAAAVAHPRIAAVFDAGKLDDDEGGWLAMELVPRGTLRGAPLSGARLLDVARDLAAALAAVHGAALVHRDVKPDNVAIDVSGHAKLLDFGVAALARDDEGAAGTRAYMSREQRAGRAAAADDVWAFGVTMIELASGRRPVADDVPWRLPVSPTVAALLWRCVSSQRPATGAELATALEDAVSRDRQVRARRARGGLAAAAIACAALGLLIASALEPALPQAIATIPVVSDDRAVQARFRAAVEALYAGDIEAAASPLAEVARARPDEPWPIGLLLLLGEHERAGAFPSPGVRRAPSADRARPHRARFARRRARAPRRAATAAP